jgi:hypothetical protein
MQQVVLGAYRTKGSVGRFYDLGIQQGTGQVFRNTKARPGMRGRGMEAPVQTGQRKHKVWGPGEPGQIPEAFQGKSCGFACACLCASACA